MDPWKLLELTCLSLGVTQAPSAYPHGPELAQPQEVGKHLWGTHSLFDEQQLSVPARCVHNTFRLPESTGHVGPRNKAFLAQVV